MTTDFILRAPFFEAPHRDDSSASLKRRSQSSMREGSENTAQKKEASEAPQNGNASGDRKESLDPAEWLEEHGNYLFRYAFSRVNSQETAEDLVQETLLAAVRGSKNFEGRSTVRTWLVGILKNKIIDYLRRSSRKEKKEVLEEDNEVLDRHFNRLGVWNRILPNWASEPNELLERKEFMAAFEKCLSKVPEKSRRAFMLKTFENIETEEICNILEITPSNLWVLLHRCRLNLRDCLEKNWAKVSVDE